MSALAAAAPPAALLPAPAGPYTYGSDPSAYRWSVGQYDRMVETGVLGPDDPVELLEGHVVLKMAPNAPHDGTIQFMLRPLLRAVPVGWDLRVQSAVVLPDSRPEPDFAVVRGDRRAYLTRLPTAAEVGLVVEVADSSLKRDKQDKTRVYARAGIPVCWLVNLVDRQVEVYSQPRPAASPPEYAARDVYGPADAVPLVLDGAPVGAVPVADLLA